MGTELILYLCCFLGFLYILNRIGEAAEKSRKNQVREEFIREMVRREHQKRRLDRLYGRDDEPR